MPKKKVIQTFSGGLAADVPVWAVPTNMVSDSKNFLFERGEIVSRPGVRTGQSTLGAGTWIDSFCQMFPPVGGSVPVMFGTYKTSDGDNAFRLVRIEPLVAYEAANIIMPPSETATAVPANSEGGFYVRAATFLNKTYLYGCYDNVGAPRLIEVTASGGFVASAIALPSLTSLGQQRYRPFPICAHLSRLLIADPGIPGKSLPTIYWSKIGDPTVWTGHFTTGNVQLQEADDGVKGMGVMQNTVLVARPSGFHIGVATGNGANPYDWKCVTRNGPGCVYPESFVVYGDLCFFAGQANIYMFDMRTITPIGEGILKELFAYVTWNMMTIRMFITESYEWAPRPQLHVIPTWAPSTYNNGAAANTLPTVDLTSMPHFVYDLMEKKWSRHIYDGAVSDTRPLEGMGLTFDTISNGANSTGARNLWQRPCLVRRTKPANYMLWDPLYADCESEATFTTGEIIVDDDASAEWKLVRVMFVGRTSVTDTICTLDVSYMQGNTPKTATKNFTISSGGVNRRVWINLVLVGNFFKFTFTFPSGRQIHARQVVFEFDQDDQEVRV